MFDLRIPAATYRLQFNKQFHFEDACSLVPYLHQLGISDLYASPIFRARKGSSHGYDVTDPTRLNPELGTETDFDELVQTLRDHKMGLLLDIVPNHMAGSPENPWWIDLLENGLCSPYASFFDIDWSALNSRVLLPILNCPYEQALENHELILTLEDDGLFVEYHGYCLPLDIKSYSSVIGYRLNTLEETLASSHSDFKQIYQFITTAQGLALATSLDPQEAGKQYRERQRVKESFLRVAKTSPKIKAFLLQNIALFSGKKGDSESFALMHNLLEQQVYKLAFWKTAREHLNYRRFSDINELIGVRVEKPQVFEVTHSLLFKLIREGKVTSLRIDHVDGLNNPSQYLSRLQQHIVPEIAQKTILPRFYITVEKILTAGEDLPPEWPVFGTTGYDFACMVNALFVDGKGIPVLDTVYSRFSGLPPALDDIVYEKKKQVIEELFPSEVHVLGQHLTYLAHQNRRTTDLSPKDLTKTLIEVTACLPIYRTYVRTFEVSARDRVYLERAIEETRRRNPNMDTASNCFLQDILTLNFPHHFTSEQKKAWLRFVLRWQQLTGAIMAKGFEDTALYSYNRLVSLNEVGGDPSSAGLSIDEFHRRNLARLRSWPYTLNATSTHDTKRSEDVRVRINVLSEIPKEWERHLTQWSEWNRPKKQRVNGLPVPEPNIETLLYQTLIGAWPLYKEEVPQFKQRLKTYMVKAVREAKAFTNWLSPNSDYESALITFMESILESSQQNDFLEDFLLFEKQIAYYGALNSLAQVLLKITSPGVPDFYQGTELWDFSLVDPDNRRQVNFRKRIKLLDSLMQKEAYAQHLGVRPILSSWKDGRIKIYVTYKALNFRRTRKGLFENGDYVPLQVYEQRGEHICSFVRRKEENWALIAVPRLLTSLVEVGVFPSGQQVWGKDKLLLPKDAPSTWLNVFTGEELKTSNSNIDKRLFIHDVFSIFPIALLGSTQ